MTSIKNMELRDIAKLHRERGGNYTWGEIVDLLSLEIPSEALRKRVQRYEKAAALRSGNKLYGTDEQIKLVSKPYFNVGFNKDYELTFDADNEIFGDNFDYGEEDDFSNGNDADDFTEEYQDSNTSEEYITPEVYALRKQVADLTRMLSKSKTDLSTEELMYDPYPPHLDDTPIWTDWKQQISNQKEIITLMFWSDMHIPDHNRGAIALALNLLKLSQPDILIHGGDMFDFDALSTFAHSRRRRFRDAIMEVSGIWQNVTDHVHRLSPKTRQVAFRGNHDSRIDRWNDMAASPFADTTEENFVEMIRNNGKVWWLGQLQETHMDTLFVQHGKKVGENAAKAAAKDQGWGTSLIQGHNHRPAMYISRLNDQRDMSNYRVIMSASAGALCNIPAHYQMDTRQTAWLHSIVMAHINVIEGTVNLQNIIFHKNSKTGKLWTAFGNDIVTE